MLKHFPFATPRPGTELAMEQIDKAFADGKRFVIVDSPCGSGKSGLSVAFARKHKTVVLTPTKHLQTQYGDTKEFNLEWKVAGKSNYQCGINGQKHIPVSEAICCSDAVADEARSLLPFEIPQEVERLAGKVKQKCASLGVCPYYTKIFNIGKVPGAILNYDLFFALKKFPDEQYGTEMGTSLVLDEGHSLIDKTREIFGFKISNIGAMRLFGNEGQRLPGEAPIAWMKRLEILAKSKIKKEKDGKKVSKFDNFYRKVSTALKGDLNDPHKFYIDDKDEEFEIQPLDMRYLKNKIFYPFKQVLILSATFPNNFKEIFGITEEESLTIKIPSFFPKENRPVIFAKDLPKLNKDSFLTKESKTIQMLDQILATHSKEKGIIHTGNYKFMEQLRKLYRGDPRFIWVDKDANKDFMLEKHIDSKTPTILVSPSMMEGVDLKDDLARFGIILKMPYPMLDGYTKRMMEIYPTWYDNLTATNVCQAYGRDVRTENDWARFYILDGSFQFTFGKAKQCFSQYFLEAMKVGTYQSLMEVLKKEEISKRGNNNV